MNKYQVIAEIETLKPELITAGFDYPTEDIETATEQELNEFLTEAKDFIEQRYKFMFQSK
jgi:hypothetical protein